jgi:pilus assembly protein CpaB
VENIMSSKLFTTRQGTILLGVIAAVIAAIALIVYLQHYRNSVNSKSVPVRVLEANRLIQAGTSGDVVRTNAGYYQPVSIPKAQVETGAFLDPASLAGKVAVTDISPGQQLTAADFAVSAGGVTNELSRGQRAVVIPLESAQQVGGQIGPGSHVDVWVASNGTNRLLYQNMSVLNLAGNNVTLRGSPRQIGVLIFASQNAQIWLALRPTIGTVQHNAPVISAGALTGH